MLEGLDQVPWDRLGHAYGPAADVPGLLRGLASDRAEAQEEALSELYGNIWHQNTVYEATSYAVPFLVELAAAPGRPRRAEILQLLSAIANGTSYHDVHQHLDMLREKAKGAEWQAAIQEELVWVARARGAVQAGSPVYLRLLGDPDVNVRASAPCALASFVQGDPALRQPLAQALATEADALVRGSLLRALGCARDAGKENLDRLQASLRSDPHPYPRVCAAMALAVTLRERMPPEVVDVLQAAIVEPVPQVTDLDSRSPWADSTAATSHLALLGPGAASRILPVLARALHGAAPLAAADIVQSGLQVAFPQGQPPATVRAADLDADARSFLQTLSVSSAWRVGRAQNGSLWSVLHGWGLPTERSQLVAFLEEGLALAEARARKAGPVPRRNPDLLAGLRQWWSGSR